MPIFKKKKKKILISVRLQAKLDLLVCSSSGYANFLLITEFSIIFLSKHKPADLDF